MSGLYQYYALVDSMFVDISHIDDAFREYIFNRLFPLFNLKISECRIELPLIGKKSCIRFLRTASGGGWAIRAFLPSQIKEARLLYSSQEFLEKMQVPVPHLVDLAEKFSSKGVSFLTEEYLEGESWETLEHSREKARILGELVSRLHRLESKNCGPFGISGERNNGFGHSQFKWVKNRLYRLRKYLKNDIPSSEFTEVRTWFQSFIEYMNRIKTFQLIHNKLNRGNVICSPDISRMYLLDFATLQYGYRGKDLVQAEWTLLRNKQDLIKEFHDEYFGNFPPEIREGYRILSPFYYAYHHLSKGAANIRRDFMKRTDAKDEDNVLFRKFLFHWSSLLTLVRESPSIHDADLSRV